LDQADLGCPVSHPSIAFLYIAFLYCFSDFQKFLLTPNPNHFFISAVSSLNEGAYRGRHGRWDGMRWTRQRRRAFFARGRTDAIAYGEVVWS
jgi:hypothetical protein